jgi:hypothetical protein
MFGLGATVNEQAYSGAEAVVDVIGLLAEPDRKKLGAQLKELHEEMKRIDAVRAALSAHEAKLLHREQQAAELERVLQQRLEAVGEREQQAQAQLQRASDATAALAQMRAELKTKLAA